MPPSRSSRASRKLPRARARPCRSTAAARASWRWPSSRPRTGARGAHPMTAPEIGPPLAALGGTTPPAPAWFHEMLALAPERRFHEVDGARIETLVWGEAGRPGLLFLHGNAAHAD